MMMQHATIITKQIGFEFVDSDMIKNFEIKVHSKLSEVQRANKEQQQQQQQPPKTTTTTCVVPIHSLLKRRIEK